MSWGAVAGAAVGVVGGALANKGKGKNGGAGTTTASKEPWEAAIRPLYRQLEQAGDLSQYYVESPFNQQQNQAYTNSYALGDYARQLVPSLLGQLSGQRTSFDPSNPSARPQSFNFSQGLMGLLGSQGSLLDAQARQAPADVAARKEWLTAFQPSISGGESTPVAPAVTPNWADMFMAGTGDRNANYLP